MAIENPTITDRSISIYDRLMQREIWIDKDGNRHSIDDMSIRYKTNVVAFLERRAGHLEILFSFGEINSPFGLPDDVDDALAEAWDSRLADPLAWLRTTPLVNRLNRDIEAGIGGEDD